ncbi:MAG: hypothetical protein ACP5D2_00210 [Candidatus Nanoarchaeia archaeon]
MIDKKRKILRRNKLIGKSTEDHIVSHNFWIDGWKSKRTGKGHDQTAED